MVDYLKEQIAALARREDVDRGMIKKFLQRIIRDKRLVKEENPANHFCCFFLPVYKQTKSILSKVEWVDDKRRLIPINLSIYLVDHIKARDWIPPGGHIKKGEFPLETVKREFFEELNYKLTKEKIELFDISIKRINKPKQICKIHYDLWYLVHLNKKINFIYAKKEFYQAGWFSLKDGLKLIKTADFNAVVKKLRFL